MKSQTQKPRRTHTGTSPMHYPPLGKQYAWDAVSDACDGRDFPQHRIDRHVGKGGFGWSEE